MRITLAVTNDIITDQRVRRIASSLTKRNAQVRIIGCCLHKDRTTYDAKYRTIRMKMLFKKGPLFYAEFNTRLFLLLLFEKANLFVANDLDTLPAVFLASKIRMKTLIYDSHEYFTELPELLGRKMVKKIWGRLEALMLPHIKYSYTVSHSIAAEYNRKYNINMKVIRNLPLKLSGKVESSVVLSKNHEKIVLYQGSLNMGRGLEMAIKAIQYTSNVKLIIIGKGQIENELKQLSVSLGLTDCVVFPGRLSPDDLVQYTIQADLGISLEEKLGLNYYYALPNKLFDYIQAGIPVLVSDLPEMSAIVNHYQIGLVTHTSDPQKLALLFNEMAYDQEKRAFWKANLTIASQELCWENEEEKLWEIYDNALKSNH
jgi:glycosyltransferase involved in cell wall biosynthesis